MSNAPHISQREWFLWKVDGQQCQEPTETLVVTSAGNRFVDIRVFKPTKEEGDSEIPGMQAFSQLCWAFAGTSSSELITGADGRLQTHSKWTHWIDSNSLEPEKIVDEGTMTPMTSGKTLESGSMPEPLTKQVLPYEELWMDLKPLSTQKENPHFWNVVLVMDDLDGKMRGMVVRVGQVCQGIVRMHETLALERWVWKGEEEGWKRTVRMGDYFVPCGPAIEAEKLDAGGVVTYKGTVWKVVEYQQF